MVLSHLLDVWRPYLMKPQKEKIWKPVEQYEEFICVITRSDCVWIDGNAIKMNDKDGNYMCVYLPDNVRLCRMVEVENAA